MELFMVVLGITAAFATLGMLADAFGTDSRSSAGDDWRRAW